MVLDVDVERGRVSLSLKALQPDSLADLQHQAGQAVVGIVTKVAPVGVVVRIEDKPDGFEGLLPSLHPADCPVAVGDTLTVKIVDADIVRRRIELALPVAGKD